MSDATLNEKLDHLAIAPERLTSRWVTITQEMISDFGRVSLDPDPMHVSPDWAEKFSPYGKTISFGFLTMALLTHMLHDAMGSSPERETGEDGYYLNYGFDRLRLVQPVLVGSRLRGHFLISSRSVDDQGRAKSAFDCTVEIEGEDRPALVAQWLSMWIGPDPK